MPSSLQHKKVDNQVSSRNSPALIDTQLHSRSLYIKRQIIKFLQGVRVQNIKTKVAGMIEVPPLKKAGQGLHGGVGEKL